MLNKKLLDEALYRISIEPRRWDQDSWLQSPADSSTEFNDTAPTEICGTKMCLAGHVLMSVPDQRYILAWKKRTEPENYDNPKYLWFFDTVEGEWVGAAEVAAAKALGLRYEDSDNYNRIDSILVNRLFMTTGYRNTNEDFRLYKQFVDEKVNEYYQSKAEDLAARVKELEAQIEAQTKENAVNAIGSDPWATLDPNPSYSSVNEEPPF